MKRFMVVCLQLVIFALHSHSSISACPQVADHFIPNHTQNDLIGLHIYLTFRLEKLCAPPPLQFKNDVCDTHLSVIILSSGNVSLNPGP